MGCLPIVSGCMRYVRCLLGCFMAYVLRDMFADCFMAYMLREMFAGCFMAYVLRDMFAWLFQGICEMFALLFQGIRGHTCYVRCLLGCFRAYVLRELFTGIDMVPERHDLTLFPTVNDLKNHLHQAFKDIENGTLGVTASTVRLPCSLLP